MSVTVEKNKISSSITINSDNRPLVSEIEPFDNFFLKTPKFIIFIIKRIYLNK